MLAVLIAFAFGFGVGYLLARRSSGTPAVGRLEVKVDGVLLPERKHSMAEFKFTADQIDAAVDKQVDGTIVLKDTAGRIDAIDPAGSSLEMTHSFPFEPTFTKADDFSTFAFKFPVDGDGKAVAGSALISGKVLEDGGTAPDDEHLISVTLIVEINATGAEVAVGPLH